MTCPVDGLTVQDVQRDYVGGTTGAVVELSCGHLVVASSGSLSHGIKDASGKAVHRTGSTATGTVASTARTSGFLCTDAALREFLLHEKAL